MAAPRASWGLVEAAASASGASRWLLPCCSVAVLIRECFRARRLRRASKLLRPSARQFPRSSSHLEAPQALGAASWRLQGLWEQLSRGSKGLGSSYLEAPEALGAAILRLQGVCEQPPRGSRGSKSNHLQAPEALGAAISRLQRLSRPKWLQPQFSRVFSSILEPGDLLGSLPTAPGGSRRPSGGFEPAQEGFPVASSGLESAPKWPRGE